MTALLEEANEEAALERLHALDCTDGLPVVVPTPERVDRMVLASGLDADLALGEMGPAMGVATVEKVAVAAVMAGCLPDTCRGGGRGARGGGSPCSTSGTCRAPPTAWRRLSS